MSSHTQKAGKHGTAARQSAAGLSHDAIKLLKTQDAGYLRTTGERIRRQMDKLEQEIQLQDGMVQSLVGKRPKKKKAAVRDEDDDGFDFDFDEESEEEEVGPKKTVFVDDKQEQRALKMKKVQEEDSGEEESFEDLERKKTARELEADRLALQEARRARKIKQRAALARQNKLAALQKQYTDITAAERQLDWQRGRMDNTVGGTNKNGIKWKIRERKK